MPVVIQSGQLAGWSQPTSQLEMILKDPACPIEILQEWAAQGNIYVKFLVASNRSCPSETLEQLSHTSEDEPKRTEGIEWMATDSGEEIRTIVAAHPNVAVETLAALAGDVSPRVRQAVLAHPGCPDHIRAILVLGV